MHAKRGICVDAHTHAYPEEIFAAGVDPVAWARARGETHWANLVAPRPGRASLQGFVTRKQMLADMDAAGVRHAVLMGWYWERPATCRWHNEFMARWIAETEGRFSAFASVQVLGNEQLAEDLERARALGFRGIGEIFPKAQGFDMRDAGWLSVLQWAQAHDWPVCLHVEEAAGRAHPGRVHADLEDYLFIARSFPKVRFIFAHWGGGLLFYELNSAVRADLKNVWYDTSATPFLYDEKIFRLAMEVVGESKVIFGSDYPLRLYPQKDSPPQIGAFLERARAQLTAAQAKAVLGGNIRTLLALP